MLHPFVMLLLVPVAAGLLGHVIGRLRSVLSFIGAVVSLYCAIRLFLQSRGSPLEQTLLTDAGLPFALRLDALSGFVLLSAAIFATLILLYSFRYMRGRAGTHGYFLYVMLALACTNGVILAANLVTLLFFWGCLLVLLYAMLLLGQGDTRRVAGKALVVVGLSDFAMLLGIALLVARSGPMSLAPAAPISLSDPQYILPFLLIAAGALAKAGSMPFHTWIPAAADTAPATVMALIPASLDKLLGIYVLTRLSVHVFDISGNMVLRNVFMAVGATTILAAVTMALVQKRMMRLLSFHAVSQVGYMVLGIGTGTAVGIAGALFHMLNNSVYKTGLFLCAGSVEHGSRTDELDRLGGLARQMPMTFISFLLCALAISGVPPLNGFFSKWMVYQGVIDVGREGNRLFPVFLACAMLGSVLTLASFLKLLHSVFFGQRPAQLAKVRGVPVTMWLPTLLLALTCVVFGVFAQQIPLAGLIYPGLVAPGGPLQQVALAGIWQPVLTSLLLLVGLGIGALLYLLGTAARPTAGRTFVGGEKTAEEEEGRVPGTAFYSSVKHLPIVGELLDFGGRGAFDLYNWIRGALRGLGFVFRAWVDSVLGAIAAFVGEMVRFAGFVLSRVQNGNLPLYVGWVFAGAVVFYLVLVVR
ncbi:NADH dehydrogenase [candidate division WOR-3 bacterium]|nr:NADH dehydrogenase [candidate division WOR-3 bacterium]